jgi:hypothetical protein
MRTDAIQQRVKRNKTIERHYAKKRKQREKFAYAIARSERNRRGFDLEGLTS